MSILEDNKSYQRHSCRARTRVLVNAGEHPIFVLGHVVGLKCASGTIGARCIPTMYDLHGLGHVVDLRLVDT